MNQTLSYTILNNANSLKSQLKQCFAACDKHDKIRLYT